MDNEATFPDNDDFKLFNSKEDLLNNLAGLRHLNFGKDIEECLNEMKDYTFFDIQLKYNYYGYRVIKFNIQ